MMTVTSKGLVRLKKPDRAKPRHLEDNLQEQCVRWFRMQHKNVLMFSIPNGSCKSPMQAALFKRTGLLAGIPDLFIAKRNFADFYNGAFIELKIGKNKLSKAQEDIRAKIIEAGYKHFVITNFSDFVSLINDYLGVKK